MILKTKLLFVSVATMFFYPMLSGCTQNPSTQKKETPSIAINNEKSGQLISLQQKPDTLKGSLKAQVQGNIGSATVQIMYHSPAVRKRVVWGGLVPYDQVWVTGAHKATSLQTDQDLTIAGKKIPAGKYALFTIPGINEWVIIINKNWQQHLVDDYLDKEDLFRIKIKPEIRTENQERLRYEIVSAPENKGEIVFSWEKIKIVIPVSQ